MSADQRAAIGEQLVEFFREYQDAGFPESYQELQAFQSMNAGAKALLKSGNTAVIEQYVDIGSQTPMIFWPPGGV